MAQPLHAGTPVTLERFAVVGSGSAGRRYLRLMRALRPDADLVLVTSGMGGRKDKPNEATTIVGGIQEAVRLGLTAAVVASPAPQHVEQALILVQAACPTLIEKPVAADSSDCEALLRAATRSGSFVGVGYTLRFDLAAQQFRSQVNDSSVGTLLQARIECGSFLPDWRNEVDYRTSVSARADLGGGVLLELSHEIDYCRWFFGEIDYVQGILTNTGDLGVEVEEAAHVMLRTTSGLAVALVIDFHRRVPRREVVVQATTGEYHWNALLSTVTRISSDGPSVERSFRQTRDDMFRRQICDFLDRSKLGLSPVVDLADASKTLQIAEAVRLSDLSGERVYV